MPPAIPDDQDPELPPAPGPEPDRKNIEVYKAYEKVKKEYDDYKKAKKAMQRSIEIEASLVDRTVEVAHNTYLNKLYLEGKYHQSAKDEIGQPVTAVTKSSGLTNWCCPPSKRNLNYDGSQGKCCCCLSNKRGVRMILVVDLLFIVSPLRSLMAFLVLYVNYNKYYSCYANVRILTFLIQALVAFGGLLAWIVLDVLTGTNEWWMYQVILSFVAALLTMLDYDWMKAVKYQKRAELKPVKKEPIDWLESDSEQGYQFLNDPGHKDIIIKAWRNRDLEEDDFDDQGKKIGRRFKRAIIDELMYMEDKIREAARIRNEQYIAKKVGVTKLHLTL